MISHLLRKTNPIYHEPLKKVIEELQIPNIPEFIATINYESDYGRTLEENLAYTINGLLKKFDRKRIKYEQAVSYGKSAGFGGDPERIANLIYGGAWGLHNLGNTEPGDGWLYRGQGLIHILGRNDWIELNQHLGIDSTVPTTVMSSPELLAQAAGWVWQRNHLGKAGDNLLAITKRLRGPVDTTHRTRSTYRSIILAE